MNPEPILESIKLSFFDINNLSWLINTHFIGFALITISILIYISKRYFSRTLNSFRLSTVSDGTNPSTTTTSDVYSSPDRGFYIVYDIARKSFFYIGMIIISVMLVHRGVWMKSSGGTIFIFNIPMISGYCLMLFSSVIEYVKFSKKFLQKIIFVSSVLIGYLIYGIGLFLAIRF